MRPRCLRSLILALLTASSACSGGSDEPSCDKLADDIRKAAQRDGRSTAGICNNPPPSYVKACDELRACNARNP